MSSNATETPPAQTAPAIHRVRLRAPTRSELPGLLAWLDAGLRGGRTGRLRVEYPTAVGEEHRTDHVVAEAGNRWVAHALARRVEVCVDGRSVPVGLVGLVYTDPAHRGRGLARACVEEALRRLRARGACIALLWSDLDAFYARLGFVRVGTEWHYLVDRKRCGAAQARAGGPYAVGPPAPEDWPLLESLYAGKPAHVRRSPGELNRCAASPDCELLVARRGRFPCAYAALGRGDDFPGVVHEWAGDPGGILACLAGFLERRPQLTWLVGPHDEPPAPLLREAGAVRLRGHLAFARLLDAKRLWRSVVEPIQGSDPVRLRVDGEGLQLEAGGRAVELGPSELLQLVLGPAPAAAWILRRLPWRPSRGLPWPLFVWGFDSV